MKGISTYINERLKFTKGFKVTELVPHSRKELIEIIKKLIDERGPEADLNDINVSEAGNSMYTLFSYTNIGSLAGEKFNGDVSEWDMSNVVDASFMFNECYKFNCDISNWDMSNVERTRGMFQGCKSFNQDIGRWDVSKLDIMDGMFVGCKSFNQDLSKWNVSNVSDMSFAFEGCESLDQDFSAWKVSRDCVTADVFKSTAMKRMPKWYK